MDFATIIGLVVGIGMLLWSIMSKSPLSSFMDGGSVAVVIGGAVAAALISLPLGNVLSVLKVVKNAFFTKATDPRDIIKDIVRFAEIARRDGILALENLTKDIDDKFVASSIQLAVDGTDPELLEQIMSSEIEAIAERHRDGKGMLDAIGKYAPAFGMIGTLIGLVIMLQNMADPSSIGQGMAIALLTTLYGALVANLVALPLADKLQRRSDKELLIKMIVVKGVMAIQSGDNPRIVEQKLNVFLPFRLRQSEDVTARAA